MPIGASVKVERLLDEMKTDALMGGLMKAGRIVEARAKVNVVDMDAVDTGHMLNTGRAEPRGRDEVVVIFSAPYTIYVHEGTRYMAARPFLTNALAQEKARVTGAIQEAVLG